MSQARKVLIELNEVKKHFPVKKGVTIKAVEDVTLKIYEGEKFGVVGESGCGKSTLGRLILQLYPQTSGSTIYYGKDSTEVLAEYLSKDIKGLINCQKKADAFYKKALNIDEKIEVLKKELELLKSSDNDGSSKKYKNLSKQINELEISSLENKKDASRQLRDGSRTVGSLILSSDLPAIQALYLKMYDESRKANSKILEYRKYEESYEKSVLDGDANSLLSEKMAECKGEILGYINNAKVLRDEAWTYHGKNILPLTSMALDLEYQKELDSNVEKGINLCKLNKKEMREMRKEMQMIFQDPAASLDPRQSVGKSIEEVFVINTDLAPAVRKDKVMKLLEQVGLKREHYYSYPHALSGGQKQRVGIARAIALDTKFVVLDESVSALDVSVQAQILQLLNELSEEKNLTYLFITHDLGVVKHFCDRIVVMYLGNVCEYTTSKKLFSKPLHPYTDSLLASVPRITVNKEHSTDFVLEGEVPSAMNPPKGCPFHTRCTKCMDICKREKPVICEVEPEHFVACHLYNNL